MKPFAGVLNPAARESIGVAGVLNFPDRGLIHRASVQNPCASGPIVRASVLNARDRGLIYAADVLNFLAEDSSVAAVS